MRHRFKGEEVMKKLVCILLILVPLLAHASGNDGLFLRMKNNGQFLRAGFPVDANQSVVFDQTGFPLLMVREVPPGDAIQNFLNGVKPYPAHSAFSSEKPGVDFRYTRGFPVIGKKDKAAVIFLNDVPLLLRTAQPALAGRYWFVTRKGGAINRETCERTSLKEHPSTLPDASGLYDAPYRVTVYCEGYIDTVRDTVLMFENEADMEKYLTWANVPDQQFAAMEKK